MMSFDDDDGDDDDDDDDDDDEMKVYFLWRQFGYESQPQK